MADMKAAKNVGIPRAKMEETNFHLAHYSGWPTGRLAMKALEEAYGPKEE